MNNYLIQAEEVIGFYQSVFPRINGGRFEDSIKKYPEEAARIIGLLRMTFVSSMSSFELAGKTAFRSMESVCGRTMKKSTLINLVEASKKRGFLSSEEEYAWKVIIELRNIFVHNNAESYLTARSRMPNGLVWEFRRGRQVEATLRHMVETIDWALRSFGDWMERVLTVWYSKFDYRPGICRAHYDIIPDVEHSLPTWKVFTDKIGQNNPY
ncbi:hypothetical protein [Pseudomonas syringae]|uniref:hypothetical protein n=1 Tax=Pseudomonas syringae TaxID=317 RepID=UPI000CDB4744|nr:hypothetical protein [Pseudomonas syringae]POP66704.1 hypothetical protein CXB35_22515 [Pseudomonas syringae]